jgi:uncharacterized protein (DUF433 family)
MEPFLQYISIDREIRSGKPCITGTRITVADILGWLAAGMSTAEIVSDFPELDDVRIRAALAFAAQRDSISNIFIYGNTQAIA